MDSLSGLREFVKNLLERKGDRRPFSDQDSLFLSGRLESVDAVEIVVFLEETFGIDFAQIGFDQTLIDSVDAIGSLLHSVKR